MTIDITVLRTITLLYVEDEDGIRAQELRAYSKLFKKVYPCRDGVEAFSVFNENKNDIDIIVTDINMPNMTGLELIEKISQISDVPFIFTTAYSDIDYMKTALNLGASKYITKPINIKTVIEDIQLTVQSKRKNKKIESIATTLIRESKKNETQISQLVEENRVLSGNTSLYNHIVYNHCGKLSTSKNGIIIEANEKFMSLFDYTKENIINKNISTLKDSSCSNPGFQKVMLEVLYEKTYKTSDLVMKLENNTTKNCVITIYPIFNNETLLLDKYDVYFSLA